MNSSRFGDRKVRSEVKMSPHHKMRAVYKEMLNDNATSKYIADTNVDIPSLDENSVLVQIKACAISDINDKIQQDLFKKSLPSRFAVGTDIAGIIKQVGSEVMTFVPGDEVVGIIPLDYNVSGCAEYVVLSEFDVVKKPDQVSYVDAAGCIGDAVKAYTALHYLGRMCSGDTVLVLDGASGFGSLAVQLSQHWGAKVISTASSEDEKRYLNSMEPELALIIEMQKKNNTFRNYCLEETGGLGVDIIIDNGVIMFSKEDDQNIVNDNYTYPVPSKNEVISALAVGGRWVTSKYNLQLDPPNSRQLFMKCASIGYLFEQAWMLSSAQQGRYQHILMDIMEKVEHGTIRPNIHHTVTFESAVEAFKQLPDVRVGKIVMTI